MKVGNRGFKSVEINAGTVQQTHRGSADGEVGGRGRGKDRESVRGEVAAGLTAQS